MLFAEASIGYMNGGPKPPGDAQYVSEPSKRAQNFTEGGVSGGNYFYFFLCKRMNAATRCFVK